MSLRPSGGLAARFFTAQVFVVAASLAAAVLVASWVGPQIFHDHLVMAGLVEHSTEMLHVEQAYRDTGLVTLAAALGTALACTLAVTVFLTRRLRQPLGTLTQAVKAMARGRDDSRVPELGAGTEVDELAEAFNTMADRLERTEHTRRRMLSDLAHEMRTPVSVLTVYVDALQDGVTHWDEATSQVMDEHLRRLTRLVEDINEVSRAEEGRLDLDRTEGPVAGLLDTAADTHREAFAAQGVTLQVRYDPAAGVVDVDRQRIGQILSNLLTNALRHTPPAGTVTLSTCAGPRRQVTISVEDSGSGIGAEHLPHLFERFYRGDTARDRDHGGSGIGLTISRVLAEAHGGTLTATSPGPGHGAVFTLELPTREKTGAGPKGLGPTALPNTPQGYRTGG
ncbi:HAMP domain-containing sensor histidine kinase [Citricoccus nitrophenolicus]|uniref:histidine kinase n=1 Tax=Citricoccus nitrophenolicus TaxID=863575 RepID=A0ABV0INM5_9MICC|nr:HAMP domain-containing sensor histidine kinase [Citricoccus sp. I39-566]NUL47791.1 HAMP domain-containing histidine kinase [Cellulosimicrobium funkei]WMY79729.1 HAMP domain-containing sensor histidine kinase [Citricoccus sp. I39-566]